MKKYISLFLFLFVLFTLTPGKKAFGQNQSETVSQVTAQDLGVAEPTLLPTSPFYFAKEWSRNVRLLFTRSPVAKTELELRFADEKIIEAKKTAERSPENIEALEKAFENYKETTDKLKKRIGNITETSKNENVDRLLDKLAVRAIKHEYLFEELKGKIAAPGIKTLFEENKNEISVGLIETAGRLEEADKLARRIKKAVNTERIGDELENVRKVEFFDRLEETASPTVKEELQRAREDFVEATKGALEEKLKEESPEAITRRLKEIPGEEARRAAIIAEIQIRAPKENTEKLKTIENKLLGDQKDDESRRKRAKDQMDRAAEKIAQLVKALIEKPGTATEQAQKHLNEANNKLTSAKSAFEKKDYGEAFGQAAAAEAFAKNGLRLIEQEHVDAKDIKEDIAELEEKIQRLAKELKSREWTEKDRTEPYRTLDEAKKHLGFARDSLAKEDFKATKLHVGHVKDWLNILSRLLQKSPELPGPRQTEPTRCEMAKRNITDLEKALKEGRINNEDYTKKLETLKKELDLCEKDATIPTKQPQSFVPRTVCTQEYNPVCGANGKTYSNECTAKTVGVDVKYKGECQTAVRKDCGPVPDLAAPPAGCKYDGPTCIEGKWKYALLCRESIQETTRIEPTVTPESVKTIAPAPTLTIVSPESTSIEVEADDTGFYPESAVSATKGSKVKITFHVLTKNIYYGGLEFRSPKFKTGQIKPGMSASVEFTADESFIITSYWPQSGVKKADLQFTVK